MPASGSTVCDFRDFKQLVDGAFRVVEVAEVHAVGRAHGDACRVQCFLDAVHAERALVGVTVGVREAGSVGTSRETRLAADALVGRDLDGLAPVLDVARARGAAVHARRVVAVMAALAADLHRQVRKRAADLGHEPVPAESLRHVVFRLAGHDAIHAPHALHGVDDHPEAWHLKPPFRR